MPVLDAERVLARATAADRLDEPRLRSVRAPLGDRMRFEAERGPRRQHALARRQQVLVARLHASDVLGDRRRAGSAPLLAAVLLLAGAVRAQALLSAGALSFGRYDDGVHYAAAIGLAHGVLPYRDVLLLQPPGLVLLLTPFGLLAEVVGDAHAFAIARGCFVLIGVLNTALVWAVLRRTTPGVVAATAGGLLYALSWPAIYVEQSTLLEVPGTTAVLGAVLLLVARPQGEPLWGLLAGLAAGAGIGVKIWYLVPAAVLLLFAGGRRTAFLGGTVAAVMVVYVPFFVAAPAAMWQEVVSAQLGRPRSTGTTEMKRLAALLGTDGSQNGLVITLLAVLVLLAAVCVLVRGSAVLAALAAACTALLLGGPSFFQHYATLSAAPFALVAGAGLGRAAALLPRRGAAALLVIGTLISAVMVNAPQYLDAQGPRPHVDAGLRQASSQVAGCLTADDPTVLILLDRLSSDVARGCPLQVDPSGAAYLLRPASSVSTPPRSENPVFQQALLGYLRSGDGYVLARGLGLGLSRASEVMLREDPLRSEHDGVELRVPEKKVR